MTTIKVLFQSTRPHGARLALDKDAVIWTMGFQSTRPHGARPRWRSCQEHNRNSFNPRARMGRDRIGWLVNQKNAEFQSTRPHGARHQQQRAELLSQAVSIHAPAWGATSFIKEKLDPPKVSIHAPAWGATSVVPVPIAI